MNVIIEFEKYHNDVKKHYQEFLDTKIAWAKIMSHFTQGLIIPEKSFITSVNKKEFKAT